MVLLQLNEFIRTLEKENTNTKIEKNTKILMHNHFNTLMMKGLQKLYEFNPNDIIHLAFLEKQPEYKAQMVEIREVRKVPNMVFDLDTSPTAMDLVHLKIIKANMELNKEYPMPRLVINKNYYRHSKRLSRFNYRIFLIFLIILLFNAISVLYYRNYVHSKIEKPVISYREKLITKMLDILSAIFLF